jgi:hypothetical protein
MRAKSQEKAISAPAQAIRQTIIEFINALNKEEYDHCLSFLSIHLRAQEGALRRTLQLAEKLDALILDHRLMRSKEGERWLDSVSSLSGHKALLAVF